MSSMSRDLIMLTGTINHLPEIYGKTADGLPLVYFSDKVKTGSRTDLLIIAGVHGEEADGVFVLSRALRECIHLSNCSVILCANPEGMLLGTRANGRGVDLNRNFPSENWRPDPVMVRPFIDGPADLALSPGTKAASEQETAYLLGLLKKLSPNTVISIHSPLGCVDAPEKSRTADYLARRSGLERVSDIGYETPGSFGSWADDNGLDLVTFELPGCSGEDLVRRFSPLFTEIMEKGMDI